MVPGQEIALRAIGTALAGMSIGFAVYMLAYGGGRTRINGLEHLAIFAQPRGARRTASGGASRRAGRRRRRSRRYDNDGFVHRFRSPSRAGTAAGRDRRGASGSRLAEDRRSAPLGRPRRQRAWRRPYRGHCRARRRLGPHRRQGRRSARRLRRRERGPAVRPQSDLPVIQPRHRRLTSSRRARSYNVLAIATRALASCRA